VARVDSAAACRYPEGTYSKTVACLTCCMKRCPGEKSSIGQRDLFQGRAVDLGGPSVDMFARKVKADPLLKRTVINEELISFA